MSLALKKNVLLAPFSWWRIGGQADYFAEVTSEAELTSLLVKLGQLAMPWCLIGNGTNILFDDTGYRGCVIRMGPKFSEIKLAGRQLVAQAGAWTPRVAMVAARAGLSGIEHTVGIPATFGGLVYMNGGSQRKGIGDLIVSVKTLTAVGLFREIPAVDCDFGYRRSRFQNTHEIILSATLSFEKENPYEQQRPELLKILRERRQKFPRKAPSCGSVFKSSPELFASYGPPGKIIEELGFKGLRQGDIQVSPSHANFIVNLGKGRSQDVLDVVRRIYLAVRQHTGLTMEPEFQYCHPMHGFQTASEWL